MLKTLTQTQLGDQRTELGDKSITNANIETLCLRTEAVVNSDVSDF
jgi:hypothetical protein